MQAAGLTCGACLVRPPPFDSTLTAVDYAFPWAGLITQLKFGGQLDLSDAWATLMLHAVHTRNRADHPLPQVLLPTPLSEPRMRTRGFNQAWELTRRVARALGCQAEAGLLLRGGDAPHQLAVPKHERHSNVKGAFTIEPSRASALHGLRVALIDDVMTTGATAEELARVAKQAGAAHVQMWVLARTPVPGTL